MDYFIEWAPEDLLQIEWFYLPVAGIDDLYEIEFVDDPIEIEFENPRAL